MMKKMLMALLVIAIAMPAMAAVTLTEVSKTGTSAVVGYNWDGVGSKPRGFGLVITATGGTITSVTPSFTGACTSATLKGYGIFPGTIVIDGNTGVVNGNGTPVEPTGLPGGPSATGTSRVVVALGSLYDAAQPTWAPANSGSLFTVVVSSGTASITISPEVTYRGGVVGEDAATITVADKTITMAVPECVKNTATFYNDWVNFGKPACWCYRKACKGDIDGLNQTNKQGSYAVGTNDLNILVPAWQVIGTLSSTAICADIDHAAQTNKQGSYRVGTNDLNLLVPNWQVIGLTDCSQTNYNFWTN